MRPNQRPTTGRQRVTSLLTNVARKSRQPLRAISGKRRATALAATGILLIGAALWVVLDSTGPKPRAREYLAFKACLLTDAQGINGKEAAPVWAGMEKASLKPRAKVQYLPAFGPSTTANTQPSLRSLTQQRCNVIVAIGAGPVAAATAE